ncbi:MAG: hypothetical protein ABIK62_04985 [candidate division WOR-3 bacterium]
MNFTAKADWPRGTWPVVCSTLTGDMHPENNRLTGTVTVRVADASCSTPIVPSGTLDSGAVVTPACSVYNSGNLTENYSVRMRIGALYDHTAAVTNHASGSARYVTFPAWTAGPRGTWAVVCSTELSGDLFPANDRRSGSVTVQVRDLVAKILLAPCGALDSGASVTPACSVHNAGSLAATGSVRMRIGTRYNQTAAITALAPGAAQEVTFPAWTARERGNLVVCCSTELANDLVPANDRLLGSVLVNVRDVACRILLAPTGTVDTNALVTPACSVSNRGTGTATYQVRLKIGAAYNATALVSGHLPGVTTWLTFPAWTASEPRGTYPVSCSTELAGDMVPVNDRASGSVTVQVQDVGCTALTAPAGTLDSGATIVPACTV